MPQENLTIGAVGVGAVGTILASCLAEAGADVIAADIPVRKSQVDENGLRVTWADRQLNNLIKTVDNISDLKAHEPDVIFVATKACLLKRIMPDVADAAGETSIVMSVQNGIGTEDEIAKYVNPGRVARMVVNYAGRMEENGDVFVNWFNPPNAFGPHVDGDHPALVKLVEMLNEAGMTSDLFDSATIKKKAYFKTTLNSSLMPLCAIMDRTMSEAMRCPLTRMLAADLLKEALAVGQKLGYDYGEGIIDTCIGYLDKGGDHHPSMSVDLKCKRPTEIDFINGKILELGQQFNDVNLETNRIMVSFLISMEMCNGTRDPEDIPGYLGKSQ